MVRFARCRRCAFVFRSDRARLSFLTTPDSVCLWPPLLQDRRLALRRPWDIGRQHATSSARPARGDELPRCDLKPAMARPDILSPMADRPAERPSRLIALNRSDRSTSGYLGSSHSGGRTLVSGSFFLCLLFGGWRLQVSHLLVVVCNGDAAVIDAGAHGRSPQVASDFALDILSFSTLPHQRTARPTSFVSMHIVLIAFRRRPPRQMGGGGGGTSTQIR